MGTNFVHRVGQNRQFHNSCVSKITGSRTQLAQTLAPKIGCGRATKPQPPATKTERGRATKDQLSASALKMRALIFHFPRVLGEPCHRGGGIATTTTAWKSHLEPLWSRNHFTTRMHVKTNTQVRFIMWAAHFTIPTLRRRCW